MKLVLVRHGATDWNDAGRLMGRLDIELNARGERQAAAAAAALRDLGARTVVASPQRRTQQTAAAVATALGVPVQTDADLAEVWVGRWEGRDWADLVHDPDVAAYLSDPLYRCDAVEGCTDVRSRVVAALERWRAHGADGPVVFVSHGDPLRVLITHCVGLALTHYRRLELALGSISVLHVPAKHAARLLLLNWRPTAHLREILA